MTQNRPPRLTYGVQREGCAHPNRLMVLSRSVTCMEVYSGHAEPVASPIAIEWCKRCGALRFNQQGRFIVPEKGRAR